MNPPITSPRDTMRGHLARLAEKLTSNGLVTELVGDIRRPSLKVALADTPNRDERVFVQLDDGTWWFWWAWEQPIAAVDDFDLVLSRIPAYPLQQPNC
jgi:hypothetical protein